MNPSQFKPFKYYSFYDYSTYNQIFENVTPSKNEILLYYLHFQGHAEDEGSTISRNVRNCSSSDTTSHR